MIQCIPRNIIGKKIEENIASQVVNSTLCTPELFESISSEKTCSVCYCELDTGKGTVCEEGQHYICTGCLTSYVEHEIDSINEDDNRLFAHRERRGFVRCVNFGDGCASLYTDKELAKYLSTPVYDLYRTAQIETIEHRIFIEYQARTRREVAEAEDRIYAERLQDEENQAFSQRRGLSTEARQRRNQERERSELLVTLHRQMPNAKQCRRCGFGPMDHRDCANLRTHHGEQTRRGCINNSCPKCAWFDPDISAWPPWDGRLHDQEA